MPPFKRASSNFI